MKYYMGVDPSTVCTGYAVLNEKGELVKYGAITPPDDSDHIAKLAFQWCALKDIMSQFAIEAIVCEDQFNGPNVDTLKKIARTSAALMIAAGDMNIAVHMMYPASWRKLFHDNGKATKKDTLKLVNEIHNLKLKTKDNDIADAIGMAHACLEKCLGGCK